MSYAIREASRFLGEPVDLFLFVYGTEPNSYFGYTDGEEAITFEGRIFRPEPIRRGAFSASGTLDKTQLNLDMAINAGVVDLFRIYPPGQPVALTIFQGHVGDTEFPTIWLGRVLSCARQDSTATLSCEPFHTSMKRAGLRRNYQFLCPHVLYGTDCKAAKSAASIDAVVVATTPSRVTFADNWTPLPPNKYIGGMIEFQGPHGLERRTILRVSNAKTLHLAGPTTGIFPESTVKVILGCNRTAGVANADGDCTNLHNNVVNFGGQPWIPFKNPVGKNPY